MWLSLLVKLEPFKTSKLLLAIDVWDHLTLHPQMSTNPPPGLPLFLLFHFHVHTRFFPSSAQSISIKATWILEESIHGLNQSNQESSPPKRSRCLLLIHCVRVSPSRKGLELACSSGNVNRTTPHPRGARGHQDLRFLDQLYAILWAEAVGWWWCSGGNGDSSRTCPGLGGGLEVIKRRYEIDVYVLFYLPLSLNTQPGGWLSRIYLLFSSRIGCYQTTATEQGERSVSTSGLLWSEPPSYPMLTHKDTISNTTSTCRHTVWHTHMVTSRVTLVLAA